MKKLLTVLALALLVSLLLVGCGAKTDSNGTDTAANASAEAAQDMSAMELFNAVVKDVELPDYEAFELDASNFSNFAYCEYEEGLTGVDADALINAQPHSVVVVKASSEEQAKRVAEQMIANADPIKWVCVSAEASKVITAGNYVMLVMSYADTTDTLCMNFGNVLENYFPTLADTAKQGDAE